MLATPRDLAAAALSLALAGVAHAQPLQVGAGQTYATPCAAVAAAKPNDIIEIAAGTYMDSCTIGVEGLTLRGSGAQPKIDLSGTDHPAQYKGIYVVTAASVTIENLELTGAHISDDNGANGAGIRVEAADLTVRGCNIHDNQDGILGGTSGTITIEHSEFANNGKGDGCNQGGCTHNLYIANIDTLNFRFNWSHDVATDTPDKGHLLKSRAKANYILYNRLSGQDGFDSYEVDLPNGGLAVLVGNVIEKGPHAGNGTLFAWGEEGASNPDKRVFVVNNTFVNDFGSGKFISASGATTTVHNNLFAGPGGGVNDADNLSDVDPLFVDRAGFDYHLMAGSPARSKGVDPGKADAFDLSAVSEYVHPLGETPRASHHDLGAFEYGTDTTQRAAGGGGAGGAASGTGGAAAAGAGGAGGSTQPGTGGRSGAGNAGSSASGARAGAGATGGTGAGKGGAGGTLGHAGHAAGTGGASGSSQDNGGWGCSVPRAHESTLSVWLGLLLLAARVRARSRRERARQAIERCLNGSSREQS